MRIFKYWVEHQESIEIDGIQQLSKVYGGSNTSEIDALSDAKNKLSRVRAIIKGKPQNDTSYEVDILEEIVHTIDNKNIVTRNRYGALVLNSKNALFIDVDYVSKTFFDSLFRRNLSPKELMLVKIEKTMQKSKYSTYGFRVYETCKGYRILVTNHNIDPKSKASNQIMKDFQSDWLYRSLCNKQNCYRARLTPKPYRIRQKGIKVIFPNRTSAQQEELNNWINSYEQKSKNYVTCRLVKQYGKVSLNNAIRYHDEITGTNRNSKLA